MFICIYVYVCVCMCALYLCMYMSHENVAINRSDWIAVTKTPQALSVLLRYVQDHSSIYAHDI